MDENNSGQKRESWDLQNILDYRLLSLKICLRPAWWGRADPDYLVDTTEVIKCSCPYHQYEETTSNVNVWRTKEDVKKLCLPYVGAEAGDVPAERGAGCFSADRLLKENEENMNVYMTHYVYFSEGKVYNEIRTHMLCTRTYTQNNCLQIYILPHLAAADAFHTLGSDVTNNQSSEHHWQITLCESCSNWKSGSYEAWNDFPSPEATFRHQTRSLVVSGLRINPKPYLPASEAISIFSYRLVLFSSFCWMDRPLYIYLKNIYILMMIKDIFLLHSLFSQVLSNRIRLILLSQKRSNPMNLT